MVDITRLRKNAEKKTVSVSATRVLAADVVDNTLHYVFRVPANALIINAGVLVKEASQAAVTMDLGVDGDASLGSALAVSATGFKGTAVAAGPQAPRVDSGTGLAISVKFSAKPTQGVFIPIVEYIEYDMGNGDYTNYLTSP